MAGYGIGLGGLDLLAIRLSGGEQEGAPGNLVRRRREVVTVGLGLHWPTPKNDAHALVARAAVILGPKTRALHDALPPA